MASDFGLIYTLNNQFIDQPGKDFSFWKRKLGNKSFINCKIGASEIYEVAYICIILFASSALCSWRNQRLGGKARAVVVLGRLPGRSKELCFWTSYHGTCLWCEQSKASSDFRELNWLSDSVNVSLRLEKGLLVLFFHVGKPVFCSASGMRTSHLCLAALHLWLILHSFL